jgi:hypothetical protein
MMTLLPTRDNSFPTRDHQGAVPGTDHAFPHRDRSFPSRDHQGAVPEIDRAFPTRGCSFPSRDREGAVPKIAFPEYFPTGKLTPSLGSGSVPPGRCLVRPSIT